MNAQKPRALDRSGRMPKMLSNMREMGEPNGQTQENYFRGEQMWWARTVQGNRHRQREADCGQFVDGEETFAEIRRGSNERKRATEQPLWYASRLYTYR